MKAFVFACLLNFAWAAPADRQYARQDTSPTVTIDSGVVIGVQTSISNSPNIVNKFLGVPFAASPTRFAPPETPKPWSEPLQATQNGPACIQQFNYPELTRAFTMAAFNNPAPPESEDCLSVNVFAPGSYTSLKPVMFWIYGGSLQFGSNSQAAYDGSSFAANQDVVLVATNYRTNVFGFPSSPELAITERNLGYLDQRLALDWVQRNIAQFGGDPDRVTIFGESAGSSSVDALVTSFGQEDAPFHAAIMQSGQSSVSAGRGASTDWSTLTTALNCTQATLDCARSISAAALKDVIEHNAMSFRPVTDDVTVISAPRSARQQGNIARVPIMTGSNSDEGIIFTFQYNDTAAFLQDRFGGQLSEAQIQAIMALYPIGERGIFDQTSQISQIYTDLGFQCTSAIAANDSASAGIPTWRYWYNATFPEVQPVPGFSFERYGAYHGSEIPLVFGTYDAYGSLAESGKRLSELIQNMWVTFARNPQGGPAPGWNEIGSDFVQVIGGREGLDEQGQLRRAATVAEIDGGRCEIWKIAYGNA